MRMLRNKLLLITGTAILSGTLFASTALASTGPVTTKTAGNPNGPQKMITLALKNGTASPVKLTAASPEGLTVQVKSLLDSGKISQQLADKIMTASKSTTPSKGIKTSGGQKSISLMLKNGSGDPVSLSASSAADLKTQVDSLLSSGKITQQQADKILSSLNKLPLGNN